MIRFSFSIGRYDLMWHSPSGIPLLTSNVTVAIDGKAAFPSPRPHELNQVAIGKAIATVNLETVDQRLGVGGVVEDVTKRSPNYIDGVPGDREAIVVATVNDSYLPTT